MHGNGPRENFDENVDFGLSCGKMWQRFTQNMPMSTACSNVLFVNLIFGAQWTVALRLCGINQSIKIYFSSNKK